MFKVSQAPYIKTEMTVEKIMYEVLLSLVPIIIFASYYFGVRVILHLLIANLTGILIEYVYEKKMKMEISVFDGSTFLTCSLLTLTLAHTSPFWISIVASIIAILFGKMIFGGLGTNIFNPALFARVILSLLFPAEIFTYKNFDGTAGATMIPLIKYQSLEFVKISLGGFKEIFKMLFFGIKELGSMGETSVFLIIIAAIFLIIRGHILLRVPFIIIASTAIIGFFLGHNPLVYITYGGIFFAAVFMATDMVTSPYTKWGLVFYSIGIGVLTALIREFSSQVEGVSYAILIMNIFAPALDELCQSRVYGTEKDLKEIKYLLFSLLVFVLSIFVLSKIDHKLRLEKNNKLTYKIEKEKKEILKGKKLGDNFIEKNAHKFFPIYENGEVECYYVENESKGYSKEKIYYLMLIELDGNIKKFKIIDQKETKGLGSKIENRSWQEMWEGRDKDYIYNKNIDGFAGASFTSYNLYKSIKELLVSFSEKNQDVEEIEEW